MKLLLNDKTHRVMLKVEKIKHEIEKLPESEFAKLRRWIKKKDWQKWDKEIEQDSGEGKLDFLIEEARKEKDELKDL